MKHSRLKRGDKPLKRAPLSPGDKPLKRTSGLGAGNKPLRVDSGKVREFRQRAKDNSNRRPALSALTRSRAYAQTEGCCVMCGSSSWIDPHHILPVQRWPELEEEWRNVIPLCRGCHDDHERANRRVLAVKLPRGFLALLVGHNDRIAYFERYYDQGRGRAA